MRQCVWQRRCSSLIMNDNDIDILHNKRHIHFIGIGGIGMSALAQILMELGYEVSGSDLKSTPLIQRMQNMGARISIGHDKENIHRAELVIYSSAIHFENPEVISAKEMGLHLIPRAKLLAALMSDKIGIAVTGAHGKTTTTALITQLLIDSGKDPTFAIGAEVDNFGGNAHLGKGGYIVAEADESDGSFLLLSPKYSVITNVDREHMDYYGDMNTLIKSFKLYIKQIPEGGVAFVCYDDLTLREILRDNGSKLVSYGLSPEASIYPENIILSGFSSSFDCVYNKKLLGRVNLNIPGIHNISNSLAAIGIGIELGIPFDILHLALSRYRGARRRFQMKVLPNDITIIDDYAHHPTEIKVTLSAVLSGRNNRGRVIAVFQPHRYTRTKDLKNEFADAFIGADYVILTDIYPAFEKPIEDISGKTIYEKALEQGHKNFSFLPKYCIADYLDKILDTGDTVVILGAGDIWEVADELTSRIYEKKNNHDTAHQRKTSV